ncbi:hypothetical protein DKY63_14620 [Pseudomonas putida]|uniref:Uncharacterized protein n=1 Tax=Pseudomonas putida TaxID=303 RepID=A0A2Z4RJC1_PSEPU|nr:hypothetical protein DKY63_14620 [Pseudomonas putida]
MLAMVVNDNSGQLTPSGVLQSIASMLAPTGGRVLFRAKINPEHSPGLFHCRVQINAGSDSRTTWSDHFADYRRSRSARPVRRFRPCP